MEHLHTNTHTHTHTHTHDLLNPGKRVYFNLQDGSVAFSLT